ncbi:MAG: FtsX-like permease family protein [Bryobacteraceae bacterium]
MTGRLVLENLKHKPMRSLLSVFLIAVPVTLILCLEGLSQGMLADSARRARGIGADIMVRPPGTSVLTLSGAPIPEKLVDAIQQKPHVALAIGMVVHNVTNVTFVTGIDLARFNQMSGGFKYLKGEGGPFHGPNDIIVDEYYAQQHKLHAGDQVTDILNHPWHVSGVAEGGKLNRLVVPIRTLQDLTGDTGRVSQVFVKADRPANVPEVLADLKAMLPAYNIYTMEEFTSLLTVENVGGLNTFIHVMVGIGVVIGFAVVLLSMYMAVLQRTREIGILKALGASRWFILKIVLAEAVVLGIGGTVVGIGLSFAARALIQVLYPASLTQAVTPEWWPIAGAISLAGVLLGALYPGMSAAAQDPIEALAYE